MTVRRDRTNQHGYVCPTENAAVYRADHPEPVYRKPKKQGIQTLNLAQLTAMDENRPDVLSDIREEQAGVQALYHAFCSVASLMGVKIIALELKCKGGHEYRKNGNTMSYNGQM